MTFPPTPEQQAIIDAASARSESLMVSALAGCAKTTSIRLLAPHLPTKSVLALAFNKKIATELEAVLPKHFQVQTMNSLGHRAFGQAIGKRLQIDGGKIGKLVTEYGKALGDSLPSDEWANLRNLVNKARAAGLVLQRYPEARKALLPDDSFGWDTVADAAGVDLTGELVDAARQILAKSCDQALAGLIDFDDQIYMSTMFKGLYPKFHTVLVEEAQDLSLLDHLQLKKVASSRLIVVGDPKQAIYAFRGADSSSMEKIRTLFPQWIDLTLSTTFRCPKKIVARQLSHAPGFNAAESAPEGEVLDWRHEEKWQLIDNSPWKDGAGVLHAELPKVTGQWFDIGAVPSISVICRNNAPLISLAFKLISKRIGINMLGRDFGKSLTTLVKKIEPRESAPVEDFSRKLTEWSEREVRLARANDKEERVSGIHDRAESILAVIDSGEVSTVSDILSWLTELFEEKKGQVTLSSGHKAKGLEWHTVIHLDPWRIPSKWARLAMDDGNNVPWQQEMNLKYVIETRAKHTLVLANLEQFQ